MIQKLQWTILFCFIVAIFADDCRPPDEKVLRPAKLIFSGKCTRFDGDLYLNDYDLHLSDFSNLRNVFGSIILTGSNVVKFPDFNRLIRIKPEGPGVIIMNNRNLRDISGLFKSKKFKIYRNSRNLYFIQNNPLLDLSYYSKAIYKPSKPLISENYPASGTDIEFAEGITIAVAVISFITVSTLFLYNASMGATNLYFIPGYHRR